MLRIIEILIAGPRNPRPAHPAGADRHVRPWLENLEGRLVPATLPGAHAATLAPALVAAADGLGSEPVAQPDRPVHGYKWRPRPWEMGGGSQGLLLTPVAFEGMAAHLAFGGQDGPELLLGSGHGGVRPPGGPLPVDLVFAGR